MNIIKIRAREILDSRGNPTIEADVWTKIGIGRASVPSGKSRGKYEAVELRDNEKKFLGKGVSKAIQNINGVIARNLVGMDCRKQSKIDNKLIKLDKTKNKSRLGANAILAVSIAAARIGALASGKELYQYLGKERKLPIPCFNIINGGKHAGNNLAFQEYMIIPVKFHCFKDRLRAGSEIYHTLKKILEKKYTKKAINVGDEGGFAPPLSKVEMPLKLITQAIKKAGYENKVKIGLDCAANEFFSNGKYKVDNKSLTTKQLIEFYAELAKKYPIISIEDSFEEDDFKSFAELRKRIRHVLIVGDDLLATNPERIKKAIRSRACSCLLLKPNQIGTVTEAINAGKIAKKAKWKIMVSHRSGETNDSFIADLAVSLGAEFIKAGAPCRGERLAKYNRLLRIEEKIS